MVFDADDLVVAGVGAAVVGILGAWATLAMDASGPDALAAVPVAAAGGLLPLGLVGAFSPSVVLGLAAADLLSWDIALVAAAAGLLAAAIGGWIVGLLLPPPSEGAENRDLSRSYSTMWTAIPSSEILSC